MEMVSRMLGQAVQATSTGVNYAFNYIDRFNVGGRLAAAAESSYAPLGAAVMAQVFLRTLNHYENSRVATIGHANFKEYSNEQTWTTLAKQITATAAGFTLLQLVLKREGLAGLNASLAKDVFVATTLTIADDRAIQGVFVKERDGKMGYVYKGIAAGYLAARLFDLGLNQGFGFNNLLRGDFGPMKASYINAFQSVRSFL